ncbi:MAG: hypothetical protein DHS80DRAFT_24525 [Piptocephalis tieghemiana]|nr:MAG: hypothetical protein DHS80DRAFT_24525 [Piptocephalis tieghemiana]
MPRLLVITTSMRVSRSVLKAHDRLCRPGPHWPTLVPYSFGETRSFGHPFSTFTASRSDAPTTKEGSSEAGSGESPKELSALEKHLLAFAQKRSVIYRDEKVRPKPSFFALNADENNTRIRQNRKGRWQDKQENGSMAAFIAARRQSHPGVVQKDKLALRVASLSACKDPFELQSEMSKVFTEPLCPSGSISGELVASALGAARRMKQVYLGWALMEELRRKGLDVYVSVCNERMYTELFHLSWNHSRDLRRATAITREMSMYGVERSGPFLDLLMELKSEAEYAMDQEGLEWLDEMINQIEGETVMEEGHLGRTSKGEAIL